MASDIFGRYEAAREVARSVSSVINFDILDLIFDGSDEQLRQSRNAQLSIFTVSMAIWSIIKANKPETFFDDTYYAGHSLGEYSALCAAGYMSIEDCTNIVNHRGQLMHDACTTGHYSMYAIIGADLDQVQSIVNKYDGHASSDGISCVCKIANDNSPKQVVISGHSNTIELAVLDLKAINAKAIKLNTSGAFHTILMSKAAEQFRQYVKQFKFCADPLQRRRIVIANFTAQNINDTNDLYNIMPDHIKSPVRWRETINKFIHESVNIIEIGPGDVQTKMVARDFGYSNVLNVGSIDAIDAFLK